MANLTERLNGYAIWRKKYANLVGYIAMKFGSRASNFHGKRGFHQAVKIDYSVKKEILGKYLALHGAMSRKQAFIDYLLGE
jgi:hypothetical protein